MSAAAGEPPSVSRHETRRNWANCFPVRSRQGIQPPHFVGAVVLEDGRKRWVRVWQREGFLSLQISTPTQEEPYPARRQKEVGK